MRRRDQEVHVANSDLLKLGGVLLIVGMAWQQLSDVDRRVKNVEQVVNSRAIENGAMQSRLATIETKLDLIYQRTQKKEH